MKALVVNRLAGQIVIECAASGGRHTLADKLTPIGATITCPLHDDGDPMPPSYYAAKGH